MTKDSQKERDENEHKREEPMGKMAGREKNRCGQGGSIKKKNNVTEKESKEERV